MKKQGALFVFEGPDGSGKTTLSLALAEHLRSKAVDCHYFSFPGSQVRSLGSLVYELHHGARTAEIESLTPTALQVLHIAAHVDAVEANILPALKRGATVILDRFWWSTWVYGRVSGVSHKALKAMIQLERSAWGKLRPTTVFLIRRTPQLAADEMKSYEQLTREYVVLATREASHYSVRHIKNEGSIVQTIGEIVRKANITDQGTHANGPIPKGSNKQTQLLLTPECITDCPPIVFSRIAPPKPTVVFETYWRFAAKRQAIFFRRLRGDSPPWTEDPVLLEYKFTNAYRASDRVSQYLIKHVIYQGDQSPEEIFFRVLLFKFFNRIETWELLRDKIGMVSFTNYSFDRYDAILSQAMSKKSRIYSAAYIMPSGGRSLVSSRKHQMHLRLLEQMMRDKIPARLSEAPTMKKAFELLRSYPTIGDFLAYQYVTDLNYSTLINFSEMDFVIPGPGARDGIRKCFSDLGGLNESEIIRLIADRQQAEFDWLGLDFQSLWGRPLQLIDCQSLFCEVDKYARMNHPEIAGITGRTRIKQRYRINRSPISAWYPPKWGLNKRISKG